MTRAGRPRWLLEELEVPYELVRVDFAAKQNETSEYAKVHPLGAVPALEDDGVAIFESGAICAYLADKFPEKGLAPAVGTPERGPYYQWMFYAMATLEPPVMEIYRQAVLLAAEERSEKALAAARESFADAAGVVERALAGKEFLLGDRFSAADIMIGSNLVWAKLLGQIDPYPTIQAYLKRLGVRPAGKRARAD